jgi:hypothetical protein
MKKQDKNNVIKTSGVIRKIKNKKNIHMNPSKTRGCVEHAGTETCGYKNANPTHRNVLYSQKMFLCSYSAIHFSVYIGSFKINYNINILFAPIWSMHPCK